MKKIILLLFISALVALSGCKEDIQIDTNNELIPPAFMDKEFDNGSGINTIKLSGQLTEDLILLGRIWGFLKYHHPEVGKGNYNWDYELFRILPAFLQIKNSQERDNLILNWINKYGDIPACISCKETPANAYIKPDLLWAENSNMNDILKAKIKGIYQNRHQEDHYYVRIDEIVFIPRFLHEKTYSGMEYPNPGFRLLTLYRYWNMIHYFFPSKYLTDKIWDDILLEYIPLFVSAVDRLEYEQATLQMIGEINDTHAIFTGGVKIEELRGNKYAPFQVRFIEGNLLVSLYYNPELKDVSGLEIGDIITHINGETVEAIVKNRRKYYPASNESARLRDMSYDLVRSNEKTISINYISKGQAGQKDIQLYDRFILSFPNWNDGWYKVDKKEKSYKLLKGNIGYVTLASIKVEDVPVIRSEFKDTKGIIIDIRNYPFSQAAFDLAYFFISHPVPCVKYTIGNTNNPGEFTFSAPSMILSSGETYRNKLIVLVNERTQSAAEFATMGFRAGVNTTIVGSTTAGADGNVSYIDLPGGIRTRISGIGIYYPDGTKTQRVGIVPDIWCEPTMEGIRQGRDELLEMAIDLINKEK